jgi:uncharacterized protein DUF4124
MIKVFVLLASLMLAGGAMAQHYKWVDQKGKVQYGDTPPAGVKATPLRAPSVHTTPPAASAADAKAAAKKGPLAPADQEADYRKRQQDAEKERQKRAQAQQDAEGKRENCVRAQENLRTLETGRVSRSDSKGERYYLEDAQIAQETVKARQMVQQWCN